MNESNHYLNKVRISLLALFISGCTFAADSRPEVEVTIGSGSQFQICQDYAQVIKEHNAFGVNFCGVAIPLNNPDYRMPEWTSLEPTENLELIKKMYYWQNFGLSVGQELYQQQIIDRSEIVPEILELYWPPVEEQVLAYIAEGKIELGESHFDIDFDGKIETVYRMTPLGRFGGARSPQEQVVQSIGISDTCDNFGLPGEQKKYAYYVAVDDLPSQNYGQLFGNRHLRSGEFFYWKGRVYWTSGQGGVFEPYTFDRPEVRQVCAVMSIQKMERSR